MRKIIVILAVCISIISCDRTQKTEENRSNYTLQVKLDTTNLSLHCSMKVEWYNKSDSMIYEIPFMFQLDSAKSLMQKVTINDNEVNFRYASIKTNGFEGFIVELVKPVKPFQKTEIFIAYNTKPNEYFREQMLFYSEDFPILQYFDNGKFNSNYQVHSDYEVKITYPSEFDIATTGFIETSDTIDQNIEINTYAKSVPSYGFVLLKDIVLVEDYSSGILIRSFYFEDDAKWGKKLLEHSKNIIEFYIDTIGFYPQPVLTIIPGYPKPYGGWPVCPNVVGIHRGIDTKKDRAETHGHWIMSHEIGHQYFGFNYVLEPLDYPQWFGIGMGIHIDRLYSLENIPEFNHAKAFSGSYLKAVAKGYNTTIMQTVDTLNKQDFDWNNSLKHDKSFSVLRMLAYEIGEDTFYEIFKYCLDNYKGVNVTLEMFKNTCETMSKRDLDDFFQTWFFTNDYLEYEIEKVTSTIKNNQFENKIEINKIGKGNISHVEIEIILENGKKLTREFDGKQSNTILKINTNEPIKEIILDPDLKLLMVNRKDWNKDN